MAEAVFRIHEERYQVERVPPRVVSVVAMHAQPAYPSCHPHVWRSGAALSLLQLVLVSLETDSMVRVILAYQDENPQAEDLVTRGEAVLHEDAIDKGSWKTLGKRRLPHKSARFASLSPSAPRAPSFTQAIICTLLRW